MNTLQAKIIWKDEEFVGNCDKLYPIMCDKFTSPPREAWLMVNDNAVIRHELTFENPHDNNALQGVWLSVNGVGMLLDVQTPEEVIAACAACCGEVPELTPRYDGTYPAYFDRVAATYTMTSADFGDAMAFTDFMLKYMKYIITGTLLRTAYNAGTGVSTYTFSSYTDPVPQGTDAVTGETSRVFDSNVPGALSGGNDEYIMSVTADGVNYVDIHAVSLAAMVTNAEADATVGPLGVWSTTAGKMRLTTTTVYGAIINVVQGIA